MEKFSFDHIHLCSRNPKATAEYYKKIFNAKIIESVQSDGRGRIDLVIDGLKIFLIAPPIDENVPEAPADQYLGLDHFGFVVENVSEIVAELKEKGAEFTLEPTVIRPGIKIAYVKAPENVRVELVERTKTEQ